MELTRCAASNIWIHHKQWVYCQSQVSDNEVNTDLGASGRIPWGHGSGGKSCVRLLEITT